MICHLHTICGLHRRRHPAGAEVRAEAFRSVLSMLDISAWWRAQAGPADAGALLVAVDYTPEADRPWRQEHRQGWPTPSTSKAGSHDQPPQHR